MKRLAFALGVVAAATFAAPLAAQSRNDGPWWDPANTGSRSGTNSRVDTRNGTINNDGRVSDTRTADGRWRAQARDRNGNIIYVRTRYDSNGNLIQERARRDTWGRYQVIDRRVVQSANRRTNDRRIYDNDRNNDGYEDRRSGNSNDRWDQNNGHDNGKHNGQYKNKNKNKNKNKGNRN
ncbi:MAG: hypothetical protein ABI681_03515 [Gemmatimonadales bacterium]